jgi:hypothetical protein
MPAGLKRAARTRLSVMRRKTNLAMLHIGRCGSTVTAEMLAQHREVVWGGELFEEIKAPSNMTVERFARAHIENRAYSTLAPIYGFETKYLSGQHLSTERINLTLAAYLDVLRSLHFSKFALLHRRNYLRRAVSVTVGRAQGAWFTQQTPERPTKVHVDVDAFQTGSRVEPLVELFQRIDEAYAEARRLLEHEDALYLVYEDDIEQDPTPAYRKLCELVGLEPGPASVRFGKTNPFAFEDMVENFEEVRAALRDTPYEWMLEG